MRGAVEKFEALARNRGLYCVWIQAHDRPNAPLISIWIDRGMTQFESRAEEAPRTRPEQPRGVVSCLQR